MKHLIRVQPAGASGPGSYSPGIMFYVSPTCPATNNYSGRNVSGRQQNSQRNDQLAQPTSSN